MALRNIWLQSCTFYAKHRMIPRYLNHLFSKTHVRTLGKGCLCLIPAYNIKFEGERAVKSLESPDPETMTHGYLIKNATISAVDSATALLTQTACHLVELEETYIELLRSLIDLMNENIKVMGSNFQEAQVWDNILHTRYNINEVKMRKQEIEILYSCAEKMLESAAEAAHVAGAEYAGIAASERLFSAKTHVNHFSKNSQELEEKLRKLEVKNIEATSKHTEKVKKRQEEAKEKPVEDVEQIKTIYEKTGDFDIHEINKDKEEFNESKWETYDNK